MLLKFIGRICDAKYIDCVIILYLLMNDLFKKIAEKYPFISHLTYGGNEFIGIIQNKGKAITSIYDFSKLSTTEEKTRFLELGDTWWWESNRQIPINIFIKEDFQPFRAILTTINSKDCEIINGPYVSLSEISSKRIKRTNIQLVRRVKPR